MHGTNLDGMVSMVVIGMAVDDTIHLFHHFRVASGAGATVNRGLHGAGLHGVGRWS